MPAISKIYTGFSELVGMFLFGLFRQLTPSMDREDRILVECAFLRWIV